MIWVPDASRSVSVCSNLLSDDAARGLSRGRAQAEYDRVRAQHAGKKGPELITLAAARANALKTDWTAYAPPRPALLGVKQLKNYDLAEIAEHIDWGPFFQTWELSGPFPDDPATTRWSARRRATSCRGQAMLKKIIEGSWLTANGVFGLFPATSVNGDDIEIYATRRARGR